MAVRDEIADLEDRILTVLMLEPSFATTEPLDLAWFTKRKAEVHAIIKLTGQGITPDIFTMADELANPNSAHELAVLIHNFYGVKENYSSYLASLKQKVRDLTIFEKLREGMREIAGGNEAAQVLGKLVTDSLSLLSEAHDRQYSFSAKDMMKAMVDKLETILDSNENGGLGVKTGISKLDRVLGALHPTDLCVVGARPGVGKTAFAITAMLNAARNGAKVGFISTEMSVDQIAFRIASQVSNLDSRKFRRAEFDDAEWSRVSAASTQTAHLPIRICDKPAMKISDIVMQCRAWELGGGLDLVIVDYLTRILPEKASVNRVQDVGEIVTQLKNLARDLKIPVMVLAQLNRNTANRADHEPRMSDLRDSGIIEQEADSILLLHRESSDDLKKDLKKDLIIVDKNRHGECVRALVHFDESTGRWFWDDEDEF